MSDAPILDVTDDTFDREVLQSDIPVLVDYWAEACRPCKSVTRILGELVDAYGGRMKIRKINVDHNKVVPAKFGVRGVPTLMLFKAGSVAATRVGDLSQLQLTAFLEGKI